MSPNRCYLRAGALLICFATSIGAAVAAETGTKTMPDSSAYPPRVHRPIYNFARHRYERYLPSDPCDNQHRVHN